MLIISVLTMTVGYTLMYAGVRVPIGMDGRPNYTYVYQPWKLWIEAGKQMQKAALFMTNPQLASSLTGVSGGEAAGPGAVTQPITTIEF